MSIIVEGMEMPKSCNDCPFFESKYRYHGCHAVPKSFNDMDMWNFEVGSRPSWCPLIDVSHCDEIIKLQDKYAELQAKEIDRLYAELEVKGIVHRKKGKWLHTPTYWYYCSVCGREPPDETNITTKFCPNCGAEMENEDEYIKV